MFDEFEGRFAARAEYPVVDVPRLAHFVPFARAAQPRIGGQRRDGVPGEFDFGNDGDEPPGGVIDHLADLLLRVIAAVGRFVVAACRVVLAAGVPADECPPADGPRACQFRVSFDLDAPSLVVRQVPVEDVHLVQRQQVERALHLFDREEMARHVEHQSPVGQGGAVVDRRGGQFHGTDLRRARRLLRQELPQRLHRIEGPLRSAGHDVDPFRSDRQPVCVVRESVRPEEVHRSGRGLRRFGGCRRRAEERQHRFAERIRRPAPRLQFVRRSVGGDDVSDGRSRRETERAVTAFRCRGARHYGDFRIGVQRPVARSGEEQAADSGEQAVVRAVRSHRRPVIRRPKRPAVRRVRSPNGRCAAVRRSGRRGTPGGFRASRPERSRRHAKCCLRRRSPRDRRRRASA